MLASTSNLLEMCSFDATKSTKGASKLRRDLINSEIANLRDLLPLPSSTRQRLSQLQLMALVCVYVRKANYFQYAFRKHELISHYHNHHHHHHHHPHHPHHHHHKVPPITNFGFSKALSGFLMMMTQNGKLLYISDNAAEYLGHSMEDLLIHGDSVYDIIEKQDHQTIQNELMRTSTSGTSTPNANVTTSGNVSDSRIFLCRMNVSRNSRRQMRFGDQKVVLVQGHFVSYLPLCSRNEPVFLATCTPVAMPETRECVVQGSTNVFTSIHSMDMKFIHLDFNGEFHLGYNQNQIKNLSWYDIVHWDNLKEAQSKHKLIIQSEQERSCILLLRLQTSQMTWIWVHVVLQVKDNNENSQQPVIVCTNQVLSDKEAAVMQANGWLYQYYSLHSKMHYMQNSGSSSSNSSSQQPGPVSTPSPSGTPVPSSAVLNQNSNSSSASNFNNETSATGTGTRSYSTSYNSSSGGGGGGSCSSFQVASEAPTSLNSMAYCQNSNGGMTVNTTGGANSYGQYGSTNLPHQQYSPQAGSLPYQTIPNQTNIGPASTPPAGSQTVRIKEEPTTATATPTRTKRSRATNDNGEPKRTKKKNKAAAAAAGPVQHHPHHHQDHHHLSSSNNGLTESNSVYSAYAGHHSANNYHGAYHPHHPHHHHGTTGTMFGAASGAFGSDLSMAYYGGSIGSAYHHHHHVHPHPHSQLAYPSHHHHFQTSKSFSSFFEHETAGSAAAAAGGSETGGFNEQHHQHHRTSRIDSEDSGTGILSSAFTTNANVAAPKTSKTYPSGSDDRRDLDKVRSPESITSATSDYGSMTSQSPPSTFEKPSPFTTVVPPMSLHEPFDAYAGSQYVPRSTTAAVMAGNTTTESTTEALSNSFHFSRLSSFQFWPSYSAATATTAGNEHYSHHASNHHQEPSSSPPVHHRQTHPHLASTFPVVDSLLTHPAGQTYSAGHHHHGIFTPYGTPTATGIESTGVSYDEKTNLVNNRNGTSSSSSPTPRKNEKLDNSTTTVASPKATRAL